jgi:serine/threonine-protein kinase
MLEQMTRKQSKSGEEELEVGDRLGPYRLEEVLGEGGMGIVFRAAHESDDAIVALKVLKRKFSADEEYRHRFRREARAASEIRHEHLLPIVEVGEADGRPYLAVQYVRGRSLEARVKEEGPLPIDDTLRIVDQIASGLDALHSSGVVHRDVKPSNIMLDENGDAWLTDFGLAKGPEYTLLTKAGQVMGTLDYIAPELIKGQPASAASDLYALGCTVFEAIAGEPPFAKKSVFQIAMAHLQDEPPDPCAARGDAPAGFGLAVLMAIAKDPGDRPPTASAYATILRLAAQSASG